MANAPHPRSNQRIEEQAPENRIFIVALLIHVGGDLEPLKAVLPGIEDVRQLKCQFGIA